MQTLKLHRPSLITKELTITQRDDGTRRVRLSSNFLTLVGFEAGVRTRHTPIGNTKGFKIEFDPKGPTKIYERKYNKRKNNPTETIIDIANQTLLNKSIPKYTERLHFTIKRGSIIVTPLVNRTFAIREATRKAKEANAMVTMTAGLDCKSLHDNGFKIHSVLEYRPQEARDKTNLTETGALNILANVPVSNVFNEDVTKINWGMVKEAVGEDSIAVLHISLPCTDFSVAKAPALKNASVENLTSSTDYVFDALMNIEAVSPAIVVVENVPMFAQHDAADILSLRLRRWGYYVTTKIMDARDYGGATSRKRYYLVASVFPNFEMPQKQTRRTAPLWDIIEPHLNECRDVSHTRSVQLGIETGRIRTISSKATWSPTLMKSQNRQAKDSCYILTDDGRYLLPSEKLLMRLSSFPNDYTPNAVGQSIASEIIGQSVDYAMHDTLIKSVADHLLQNTGKNKAMVVEAKNKNPKQNTDIKQFVLF